MTTRALIHRLDADRESGAEHPSSALSTLLDDTTIEPEAPAIGIREAADLVGLTPYTLRYYEQQGLVTPERNALGRREYSAFALRRLVFLVRMRVSGMPMRELTRYISFVEQGDGTIPARRAMMHEQRDRIRQQQRELELALEATEFKIRTYGGNPEP